MASSLTGHSAGQGTNYKASSGSTCYKCRGQDGKTEDGGWIAVRVILSLQGELFQSSSSRALVV